MLTSQKQLTFQELLRFTSIEEARSALIDREIESVLRKSHHEQFEWLQTNLSVKLKVGLSAWPRFVELCERRNLFTHTGGIVSQQYLFICSEQKCDTGNVALGQTLGVGGKYFKQAVETIYEVGLELCYVFWRKFDEAHIEDADRRLNARAMDLIADRAYSLAEALLTFSHKVPKIKDETRRMMIVNLANALRLQEKGEEAKKLLDSEDWSATNDEFRLCVAAVRGELETVLNLMEQIGKDDFADRYRSWPAFRGMRESPAFVEKFESIYGEPFILIQPNPRRPRSRSEPGQSAVMVGEADDATLH